MAELNTNTRYLHPNIVEYARRLTETLPPPLEVCFFVNSGSEANDLALRLARTHTGFQDMLVLEHAYHGHTGDLIEISPYKFDGKGGKGSPPHTHKVPIPDRYRGKYRAAQGNLGMLYASDVAETARRVREERAGLAGFIAESIVSCGGQIILPDGYLREAFESVRRAGGVCISDEVQVGMGRVGSHFWGFETQGVVPDIVTAGKPIGNGHPLAAVITSRGIAESFCNGMEYFNTFGGNPVSCAVGLEVLRIIEEEGLQRHSGEVGGHFLRGLKGLMGSHSIIGDVRGLGLFIGVELVRDRETLEPAGSEAADIVEAMKERGVLLSTDGPFHNVIKIKPPLVFTRSDADSVVENLDQVLGRLA
jgi:4-aminobutyrate aminotransferase-like enzyme